MSDTYERYERWTARARAIATCSGVNCAPESHVSAIRYLAMEAYDNGLLDGMQLERERADPLSGAQTVPGVRGHLTGTENSSERLRGQGMATGRDGGLHGE